MWDLHIFSVAEHDILAEIALFEVQEAAVVAHAYEVCTSKLFPRVLEKGELIEAGVVKVIAEIDMSEAAGSARVVLDPIIKGVNNEISDTKIRVLGRRCVCLL